MIVKINDLRLGLVKSSGRGNGEPRGHTTNGRLPAKAVAITEPAKTADTISISSKDICGGMIHSSPRDLSGNEDRGKAAISASVVLLSTPCRSLLCAKSSSKSAAVSG